MEKKIPLKNYVILILLTVLTLSLVFVLSNKYKSNFSEDRMTFVTEIKENDINEYVLEGNDLIIYMSNSKNNKIAKFEEKLKEYTEKNELKDKYMYLDLNEVSDNFDNEFYVNYFNESFNGNFEIKEPTLVIIKDKKIVDYKTELKTIEEVKRFFERNGEFE